MSKKKTASRKNTTPGKKRRSAEEEFGMPRWMECTWRRVPCGMDSCEMCGKVKRDRDKRIAEGQDPEDISLMLEDARQDFDHALGAIKARAAQMGIKLFGSELMAEGLANIKNIEEPPRPAKFPLYYEVKDWRNSVFEVIGNAEEADDEFWVYTEAVEDLAWYANLLPAKVYRQLCNRWYMAKGDGFGRFDYAYTKYVIGECVRILRDAFAELASFDMAQKGEFLMISAELLRLEDKVLDI